MFSQSASIADWSLPDFKGTRVYRVAPTMFRHDYIITVKGKQLLHVDNSSFTLGKPDLTFHAGSNKDAPVVSVCKFLHFSRHLKVGFGDPNNLTVVWEDLAAQNLMLNKYRIEMTVGSGGDADRKSFLWQRSMMSRDFKLTDERTGELVAVYRCFSASAKRADRLEIHKTYGPDFELMAITTALGLAERRRRRESNSGGGGSGGS